MPVRDLAVRRESQRLADFVLEVEFAIVMGSESGGEDAASAGSSTR